jgi:hypothetical protein
MFEVLSLGFFLFDNGGAISLRHRKQSVLSFVCSLENAKAKSLELALQFRLLAG